MTSNTIRLSASRLSSPFVAQVEKISGQKLLACYQCGKCSAGCPMAAHMDLLPNQILRLAQLGMEEKLLASRAIWICVSCMTCNTRCPKDVRIAEVIEAIRETVLRGNARRDQLAIADLPAATLTALPPIALIAAMRKLSA
ncbi:MAG: 4Fe-4S dicluster domain-containing protein [Betaproteobacteria bacterium]|nr:4Fe-4S dicluster domain-containing protein [Betaproteobacteria bacterium]